MRLNCGLALFYRRAPHYSAAANAGDRGPCGAFES